MVHAASPVGAPAPLWIPEPTVAARSTVARFARFVRDRYAITDIDPLDYDALWEWSTAHTEPFWEAVWEFFGVRSSTPHDAVLSETSMPGARWFPGAHVNYAREVLTNDHRQRVALVCLREDGRRETVTWDELRRRVGALAQTLRELGVNRGDRVVGYLPPGQHAVIALLAAASLGAIWAQCAQDLAAPAVVDRFEPLAPTVLFAADGYAYNGRYHDRRVDVAHVRDGLRSVTHTIVVDHQIEGAFGDLTEDPTVVAWEDAVVGQSPLRFEDVPFDHPLWVLFSSGTTGPPKGIVHGHGGIVLGLLSLVALHMDLRDEDTLFWYTSTNWMMWNVVVSSLLTGVTAVIYDGSPTFPHVDTLWRIAAEHEVTFLGASPGYLQACERAEVEPGRDLDLRRLRTVGSTGSTLPASSYLWVHGHVGEHIQLSSTTGGTDAVTAFACSAPTTPVWPGEISARSLGVCLEAWNASGEPVTGEVGELVLTKPLPSMPVCFWNDPTGERYRDAYFAMFPGVWRHGDWVTVTDHGSVLVHGRSDSTLNRHGVRLGSSEIYQAVESLPQIRDSLVVGVDEPEGGYWMPLFVVLSDGVTLDDGLRESINGSIRCRASPRHVPDEIVEVRSLPHTRTGKKLEVPLKRILQGADRRSVLNVDAVDDPESITPFVELGRARRAAVTGTIEGAGR